MKGKHKRVFRFLKKKKTEKRETEKNTHHIYKVLDLTNNVMNRTQWHRVSPTKDVTTSIKRSGTILRLWTRILEVLSTVASTYRRG